MTDSEKLFLISKECWNKYLNPKKTLWMDIGLNGKKCYRLMARKLKRQGWRPKGKV